MSDPAVVAIVKAKLVDLAPTPFIDTLNVRPSPPLPSAFFTIKRDFANVQRITLGPSPNSQFREVGTLVVAVAVRSGTGEAEAQALAESVRNLFVNYYLEHFQVTTVDSAVIGLADEGNYFQLDVPVRYQFDYFR